MRTIGKWAAGCLLGLGLVISGCDSGGEGGTEGTGGDLVGKWYIKRSVSEGFVRALDGEGEEIIRFPIDQDTAFSGNEYYVEFKSDNTYAAIYPDAGGFGFLARRAALEAAPETGTWSVSGGMVTAISSMQDTVKVKADIDGSSATFTIAIDEVEVDSETGEVIESDIESTYYAAK